MPVLSRQAQRREPAWWTARRLPEAVGRYETGQPPSYGSVGLLDLQYAVVAGATRPVRHFHRTPLYILRPIYLDETHPGMAFVYLQHQGDGLLQGDRYRMDIEAAPGAQLHVTTQGATKIYGMDEGYATQLVNLTAGAGSLLEYLPEPVIPFARSRFFGQTTVTADPDAVVLFADTLLPGRAARGERHDYDAYCTTTVIRRPTGEHLAVDSLTFGGAAGPPDSPARMGAYDVHAAFFVLAPADRLTDLDQKLGALADHRSNVLVAVSTLPFDAGLVLRVLGPSSIPVRHIVHSAWDISRRHLTGTPAPDLRKD